MPLNLSAGHLRKEHCATSIEYGLRPGESKLAELDTDGIFHCLQRGRFCPEALRAAQYVLRVLLQNAQHAQHVQNANNTRITRRTRRTRSTAF